MKRLAATLLAIVLAISLAPMALAAEYENANWLYADWELNGYPDDVGGVYSYDGDPTHLCILLVDDDGTREAEIRASLADTENVRFGSATSSFGEVYRIKNEIFETYMTEEYGVTSCVSEFAQSDAEFIVSVTIDKDKYAETSKLLTEKYGELVKTSGGEDAAEDTADKSGETGDNAETAPAARTPKQTITYIILYGVAVLCIAMFMSQRRKKKAAERSNNKDAKK